MLPLIDLKPLLAHARDPATVAALDHALQEYGCCYLQGHGIAQSCIDAAQAAARAFFAQSDSYKLQYAIAQAPRHAGYVPFSEKGLYQDEQARMYEAFDLGLELTADDPDFLRGNIFYGPNTWPDQPGFRAAVYGYYEALSQLAQRLSGALEAALGLAPGNLQHLMRKPCSQLRLIHYPAQARAETQRTNMGAHTDYEFFTLLYQSSTGLQSMDPHGVWRDAPPLPGTLVMNVGDLAQVISGARYRSNPHRVLHSGKTRYSMPYFATFDYDTVLSPLCGPQAGQADAPRLHSGQHLEQQVVRDFAYLRAKRQLLADANPFLQEKIACPQ
ncbi:2-oxoglutarate and iron-dependent oxygenase domain-containing protein [Massilia sp. W12]|uniref:isopenicillin N synthase family dioxygenase n=1 Tax=Massilia sp. W12 TaxID=3126507 RepID=UPI0030D2C796